MHPNYFEKYDCYYFDINQCAPSTLRYAPICSNALQYAPNALQCAPNTLRCAPMRSNALHNQLFEDSTKLSF